MSFKSPLFSVSGTEDAMSLRAWRNAIHANWEDARFFRSWLVYDSNVTPGELPRINWYKVLGLTLVIAISSGVWAGIGLMIAYFRK